MKTKILQISGLIVGLLLAALIVGPFLIPVPPLEGVVAPRQLADPDSLFLNVNGVDLHYKVWGAGEPAWILLHGFGSNLHTWDAVVDGLAAKARVIAFDRPAYGLSGRPLTWEGENPYSPEAQLAQIVALMNALGVESAILVGNSAGGTVAVNFALAHPERVAGLVLVDAAIYSGGGAPAWVKPLLRTPQMNRLGPLVTRRLLSQSEDLLAAAWHDPAKITPEIMANYEKPTRVADWDRALWQFTLASRDLNLDARLGALAVPVLVITGDDDRVVPTEQSLRLAEEINGAALAVLPACGHVPQEECPAEFLAAVKTFMGWP